MASQKRVIGNRHRSVKLAGTRQRARAQNIANTMQGRLARSNAMRARWRAERYFFT
jgi:hypothetical protein